MKDVRTSLFSALFGLVMLTSVAQASGPVERMLQVLVHPSDNQHLIVRWGIASEGYLFSHDGGRTFVAMCSQFVAPTDAERADFRRISGQDVPMAGATLIDANGKLLMGQIDAMWSDDGTGCNWSKQFDGVAPFSLKLDPTNNSDLLSIVVTRSADNLTASAKLVRRDAAGVWHDGGLLKPEAPQQRIYGGDLVIAKMSDGDGGTRIRLYARASVATGALSELDHDFIFMSDDGGMTWSQVSQLTAEQESGFVLLAADPLDGTHLIAAQYRNNATDTLLYSDDAGKTFRALSDIRETSGVAFLPDGRVFIGDAGDSTSNTALGGMWTAARLGQPLTQIPGTQYIDCVDYDPDSRKLRVCKRDTFGLMDPVTGQFTQLSAFLNVQSQLSCPGKDVEAACSSQYNAGPSWCCQGHYPFTPFCADYDVTMDGAERVFCGLSGREYDEMIGRVPVGYDAGPKAPVDAGIMTGSMDAGTSPSKKSDDGCNLAGRSGRRGSGLLLCLLALAYMRRRRRA